MISPNNNSQSRPVSSGTEGYSPSPTSNASKTGKKKRKTTIAPISLEDVFLQVSNVTSSNLNPPPGKVLLTPRSAEVCLKLGVNPEILKIRDVDSFWESNIDPAVQKIRHEAYVQRRHETMKQCRHERKRMTLAEFETSAAFKSGHQTETLTPEMILQQQKEQNSTLIQLELQRIEKMQKRQQKELEQMIQFEANRAKLQQEMEKRIQEGKKKDELRKKQLEKRMKLMAEERRLRELQRSALDEAEEENRRAMARDMHEKERAMAEERKKKLHDDKKKMQEEEIQKKMKNEEHRRQVEQYFAEEQQRLRQRLESMQFAEKKKQDAILQKQREHMDKLRRKREAIERRIEENMEIARKVEEKRKQDFLEKQESSDKVRENHARHLEEERMLKAQEIQLQEQRRRMILLQQQKEEEHHASILLNKFEEEQRHVEEIQMLRERENTIHRERKVLRSQLKMENVHRVMRVADYKRMNVLKRIEDTDHRIKGMLDQKVSLIEERRRAARETKMQKESIAKVMEEVRTNASKANKIITQALSGRITLDSLLSTAGEDSMVSRTRSAGGNKTEKKKSQSQKNLTSDLLGLSLNSLSAGNESQNFDASGVEASNELIYSSAEEREALPYVSPYVTDETGGV